MSRGLSDRQSRIVQFIQERGIVDIFDLQRLIAPPVDDSMVRMLRESIWRSDRAHAEGDCRCKTRRDCRANRDRMRNASDVYRMMQSLEKRGLVAALTNHQPRTWILATRKGDGIEFPMDRIVKHASTRVIPKLKRGWVLRMANDRWRVAIGN